MPFRLPLPLITLIMALLPLSSNHASFYAAIIAYHILKTARIDPTNHLASSSLLGMAGPVNSLLSGNYQLRKNLKTNVKSIFPADQISKLQNNSDFGV
eukprot:51473-Amorphochlora_amoeboformis.AAC.3